MHQIHFWLGLHPRPCWEAYSAPPDLLAGFKGPTSKRRGGEGGNGGREKSHLLFCCGSTPMRQQIVSQWQKIPHIQSPLHAGLFPSAGEGEMQFKLAYYPRKAGFFL